MRINNIYFVNKTILAPMMEFSDQAFRILCRRSQASAVFTQKFNINALINNFKKFEPELEIHEEEHPIIIQLIGKDPKILSMVMDRLNSYEFDGFDLNLGCPSPDSIRDG
ncbi:MAG: tRNA-dihydrouridine synthase, partial [Candidatus Helarchaeota archaeon]